MSIMEMYRAAIKLIRDSRHLVAFTGAGISAESGIPTFRGRDGLWKRFRAEDLATPQAFKRNPKLVWKWYCWRMNIIKKAKPNPSHKLLSKLEEMGILKAIITQNVDDLHLKAGSKNLIRLHGSIWNIKCIECDYTDRIDSPPKEIPPRCPKCNSLLRPGVVWFGEPLPPSEWSKAVEESTKADVMLVIGTSGMVAPASNIPYIAKSSGASIIEINIEPSMITPIADVFLKGKAGEVALNLSKLIEIQLQ